MRAFLVTVAASFALMTSAAFAASPNLPHLFTTSGLVQSDYANSGTLIPGARLRGKDLATSGDVRPDLAHYGQWRKVLPKKK